MNRSLIPVGLLGADYEVADGSLSLQDDLRRCLSGTRPSARRFRPPESTSSSGEFLLAVDGKEIKTDSEVYRRFEGTAGKRVELTVGPSADGKGVPHRRRRADRNELELRNRAWIEANLRKVHERTKGRVAYVYVPNTADMGYDYFKRYFFPQADKDAIIVDERFNGGGQVADYYIELLRRPLVSFWATRYGEPCARPMPRSSAPR